ncbi:MAG TPA: radical SAM protein [Bacillota bacterium]|nr:radical SAM protein [Peptococcaceae bacterium MAG4]NLW37844.1 radical SAM protein [Peptococcaceae bacterium]HUM59408.1 radical SAM protein [Bacillota bacterium]
MLDSCRLCPRKCEVDRTAGKTGFCRAPLKPKVARAALHFWEEPCLSGVQGSGTVFFSHCNLKCIFCQNYRISQEHFGREVDIPTLASIFRELEQQGAHNINLVSPTPYIPQVAAAIKKARSLGMRIPVVYNSNAYEETGALAQLEGLVDIYLPDLKYASQETADRFSGAPDYFTAASQAIREMYRQVGPPSFDTGGLMTGGLMIRHLILPGQLADTIQVLRWIAGNFPRDVYVSLMAQYFPTYRALQTPPLNRRLTTAEYNQAVDTLLQLGLESGYVQELSAADQCYVPNFDGTGVPPSLPPD